VAIPDTDLLLHATSGDLANNCDLAENY
jgi:hypothetical protein